MKTKLLRLVILSMLYVPALYADDAKDLQKHLHDRFFKKAFFIRNFYGGNHLIFDSQGNLLEGSEQDCWCAALMEVRKIEVTKDILILRGPRIIGWYDSTKKALSNPQRQSEEVQLDIKLDPAEMNEESIVRTLIKIFITRNDDLENLIPENRKEEKGLRRRGENAPAVNANEPDVAPGKGTTPPEAVYSPDPVYPDGARKRKREGDVVLWAIIDETGHVAQIKI